MRETSCSGARQSVSRVPGAPPETSTLAANGPRRGEHGGAGLDVFVVGVADDDPGHVGDQVAAGRRVAARSAGAPSAAVVPSVAGLSVDGPRVVGSSVIALRLLPVVERSNAAPAVDLERGRR